MSPVTCGFRGTALFVPTNTLPSATTGFPYEVDPSSAFQRMFAFVLMSHVAGRPVIGDDMFRPGAPPHMGQSCDARGATAASASSTAPTTVGVTRDRFVGVVISRAQSALNLASSAGYAFRYARTLATTLAFVYPNFSSSTL